jgi:ribosomal protein S18 acetylase RimI-like enzyme
LDADPRTRPQARTWRIRRATVADAHDIAEIGVLGWRAAYRGILPDDLLAGLSVEPREVAWRSLLESDPEESAPAWVAEGNGRVVGFVSSGPPRDDDAPLPAAEIYAIYVAPEAWRRGVGRALLDTAVNHWRTRGAAALVLWVLEANAPGRAFYDALGWRPDGRRQEIDLGGQATPEVRYRLGL